MDPVGGVTVDDLAAEAFHLREVGHVGDMRRDAQALWQPRRLAEPHRFRHPLGSKIANRDIASLGNQLAHQLPVHPRAAARDNRDPASEVPHVCFSLGKVHAVRGHSLRKGFGSLLSGSDYAVPPADDSPPARVTLPDQPTRSTPRRQGCGPSRLQRHNQGDP